MKYRDLVKFGHEFKEENHVHGGVQYVFSFVNEYGASVVRHSFSYGNEDGLWELAVLHLGNITYSTYITDDVIGWLSDDEVSAILSGIKSLT